MKLSDYMGEDALDLLADILDPATEILADKGLQDAVRGNKSTIKIVQMILRNHKASILEIMARIDGVDPAEYKPNALTLPLKLLELFNDEDLLLLFQSQGQMNPDVSSGSAMESTGGTGEE